MGVQHSIANWIASYIGDGSDETEESAMLIFGIELFLNEFLKIIFIICIAILLGELQSALLGTSYLFLARKISGGKHFKKNIVCTLFSLFSVLVGPMLCLRVECSHLIRTGVTIIETIMIAIFVPYKKKSVSGNGDEMLRKALACIAFWLFLWIGERSDRINAILFIEMIVIFAICRYVKKNKKQNDMIGNCSCARQRG